jgi:hypothetical protein
MKGATTDMMTTNEYATMIAVFVNRDQAEQAIDNLRHAGYSYEQIRFVEHGANSFVESLKGLFRGQSTATTNSADDWMRIGVPEQDAHYYQSELDAGRNIVLIKAVNNPEQSLAILRQSGAYDLTVRLRTAPPTMGLGTSPPNVQPGTSRPTAAPGTYPPTAQPGTYNPNVAPGPSAPNVPPGTDEMTQPQPRQSSTRDEQNTIP